VIDDLEARRDTEILGRILLLGLGDISAAILAVEDTTRRLPLELLWQLCDSFDSITNRQEVHESDGLFANDFDGIDRSKLAQFFPQLILSGLLRQISKVDVPGGAGLLDRQSHRSGYGRWLSPSNLDILSLNAKLLQNSVRVKMSGRTAVKERDESTVLISQKTHRLDRTTSDMAENFFGRCVRWNVTEIDCSAL